MSLFSLTCQVAGSEHAATAESRGRAIAVFTDRGVQAARSVHVATRIAGEALGPLLDHAERRHAPWGLLVEVGSRQAVYGEWPLLPGPPHERRPQRTELSRLRALWLEEDGALAALNNAIRIIEAFAAHERAMAA